MQNSRSNAEQCTHDTAYAFLRIGIPRSATSTDAPSDPFKRRRYEDRFDHAPSAAPVTASRYTRETTYASERVPRGYPTGANTVRTPFPTADPDNAISTVPSSMSTRSRHPGPGSNTYQ